MRYAFQIGEKNAEINCSDDFTKEELEIVKEMLSQLIASRVIKLKEQEQNKLPLTADIDSLYPELSVRARNILKRNKCNTIGDVLGHSLTDIKRMRNMGKTTFEEIKSRFGMYGQFLGEVAELPEPYGGDEE